MFVVWLRSQSIEVVKSPCQKYHLWLPRRLLTAKFYLNLSRSGFTINQNAITIKDNQPAHERSYPCSLKLMSRHKLPRVGGSHKTSSQFFIYTGVWYPIGLAKVVNAPP